MTKHLKGIGFDEPRTCIVCGAVKPAVEFYAKNDDYRRRECSPCLKEKRKVSAAARQTVKRLSKMEREQLYGKPSPTAGEPQAFWSRINKRGKCWLWTGALSRKGYGQLNLEISGIIYWKAHRVSWAIHNGEIPDDRHVLHSCDNPWCVNPEHLYLGTNQENVDDKKRNGRQLCGERMNTSKLTPTEVQAIRLSDKRDSELASEHGIHVSNIKKIRDGRSWKHLPWPTELGHGTV